MDLYGGSGPYRVPRVARGDAAGFYGKYGFRPAGFAALAHPYDVLCEGCPDRETCRPLPMVFEGDMADSIRVRREPDL